MQAKQDRIRDRPSYIKEKQQANIQNPQALT